MLQVGRPVTGQNLIGRDKEINLIRELIKGGQNFVIIAPRRMEIIYFKTQLLIFFITDNYEQYKSTYRF